MTTYKLRWTEDLSSEQFDELIVLSRQYHEARHIANQAELKYKARVFAIAKPFIDAKLSAIGASDRRGHSAKAELINEYSASPMKKLTIAVSNEPDPKILAVMDQAS